MCEDGILEGIIPSNSQEFWDYVEPIVTKALRWRSESDETMILDVAHRTFEALRTKLEPVNESYIATRALGIWLRLRASGRRITYVGQEVLAEKADQRPGPEDDVIFNDLVNHLITGNPWVLGLIEGQFHERIAEEQEPSHHAIEQRSTRLRQRLRRDAGRR